MSTALAIVSATTRTPVEAAARAVARASAGHYRQHHDFESLEGSLPALRLGTPRADVEALLGEPTYCPIAEEQCYYASSARNAAGGTLTLVVEYRLVHTEERDPVRTARLESVYVGPVAE